MSYSINGTVLQGPPSMPVTAYQAVPGLLGTPYLQGPRQLTWQWNVMPLLHMQQLMALYNRQRPQVTITFFDHVTGDWLTAEATMLEPNPGTRDVAVYRGVSVQFYYQYATPVTFSQEALA